jgi:hypothetical protein
MNAHCHGCTWIAAELKLRQQLCRQYFDKGDVKLATVVLEGISSLLTDWRAHMERDHAAESLLTPQNDEVQASEAVDVEITIQSH